MGEDGEALQERIEPLSGPGAEAAEEAHAGITAVWTAVLQNLRGTRWA
jgi:hypothetical protein